jgi:hypothetical protein
LLFSEAWPSTLLLAGGRLSRLTGRPGADDTVPNPTEPEAALRALRQAYAEAVAHGSPASNAFANLAWILSEESPLSIQDRAEAVYHWLGSSELDRWRAPIQSSQAGENTLMSYDARRSAAGKIRIAAARFVDAAEAARLSREQDPDAEKR